MYMHTYIKMLYIQVCVCVCIYTTPPHYFIKRQIFYHSINLIAIWANCCLEYKGTYCTSHRRGEDLNAWTKEQSSQDQVIFTVTNLPVFQADADAL